MCIVFKEINELDSEYEDMELEVSAGKHCPSCANYIEKNNGCNHMTCYCGFQFCWVCLGDYAEHSSFACKTRSVELKAFTLEYFLRFSTKATSDFATHHSDKMLAVMSEQRRRRRRTFNAGHRRRLLLHSALAGVRMRLVDDLHKCAKWSVQDEKARYQLAKYASAFRLIGIELSGAETTTFVVGDVVQRLCDTIESTCRDLNTVIEYLALFLGDDEQATSKRRSEQQQRGVVDTSAVLKASLHKAILYEHLVNELVFSPCSFSGKRASRDFANLISYHLNVVRFFQNLQHIYSKCISV